MTNVTKKPTTNSIGDFSTGRPPQIVAIQQKTWMPEGIAIMMLAAVKKLDPSSGMPVANMWCTHLERGDDDLHGDGHRRHFRERDHLRPHVGALADAVVGTRQRHIVEPAVVGADVQQERDPQEQSTK